MRRRRLSRSPSRRASEAWVRLASISVLLMARSVAVAASDPPVSATWQDVIAATPYWESQGVYANLVTLRRWVLTAGGFCEEKNRHILFDRRMRFLGYLTDPGDTEANQQLIDTQRLRLAQAGKVDMWVRGDQGRPGYPFVLSCDQPDAHLPALVARYTGADRSARLWGTWDGMRVGREDRPVSLHEAIRHVYRQRSESGRVGLPETVLSTLAGKVIIESGGVREAQSPAGALGIMQLSPGALADCRLEEPFQLHRLAQIDCALYLLDQNHRNLAPVFNDRFGHLPARKAEALYGMLLLQSYHGGVGRVTALLQNETLNAPARYFAAHAERFSAGDIALGMVFHNLGREQLGFASLYYVADVSVAAEAACKRVADLPGCIE